MFNVYGCIITPSGELQWSGEDAQTVQDQLLSLPGTTYGKHWWFPRDTGLEYSDICLSSGAENSMIFYSEDAVDRLLATLDLILMKV